MKDGHRKLAMIIDRIKVSIFCSFWIVLGAFIVCRNGPAAYRLWLNQYGIWYKSDELGLTLLGAGMVVGGTIAARFYLRQWRGLNTATEERVIRQSAASQRRERAETIALALFIIGAGIVPLVQAWRYYMPLHPRQVPRTTVAALQRETMDGALLAMRGHFEYRQVWRSWLLDRPPGEEKRVVYYYPFVDLNSGQRIQVATTITPEIMAELYGEGEQTVAGVWHLFTPEERQHTYQSADEELRSLLGKHPELAETVNLDQAGLPLALRYEKGMPFPGALNLVSEVDDPFSATWLIPVAGFIFGVPMILLGLSLLKPLAAKARRPA